MTDETRTIEIPVYRCSDGLPSCTRCPMITVTKFAVRCGYTGEKLDYTELVAGNTPMRIFRPSPNCPLWKGEK